MTLSPQFISSVAANIAYWAECTRAPEDKEWNSLARERPNLIRAAQYGQAIEETWRETARLLLQCYELIERQAAGSPWIPLFESLVERCPNDEGVLKCELMNRLGNCYRHERQLDVALEIHLTEYQLALALGDQLRLAHAQVSLSMIYFLQRSYNDAEHHGRGALVAFEELQAELHKQATAASLLGVVAQARGDLDLAEVRLKHAIHLYRQSGHTVNLARTHTNLAIMFESAGKTEEALNNYHQAISLLDQTDFEFEKSKVKIALGVLYYNQGNLEKAEAAWRQANSLYLHRSGQPYWQAFVANNLGNIDFAKGRLVEAESRFRQSIKLLRAAGAHLSLANSLGDLAKTLVAKGNTKLAIALYEEAITICRGYTDDAYGKSLIQRFEVALAGITRL